VTAASVVSSVGRGVTAGLEPKRERHGETPLEPEGHGFRISRSALTLRAKVPNLDAAGFARMAGDAEKNCPVSKVLNASITLDVCLMPAIGS
jgi:osmotically inducible protein OsmC